MPSRFLSLLLAAAVLMLAVATVSHVHGVSDPGKLHTVTDFLLQFQSFLGILLASTLLFIRGSLPAGGLVCVVFRPPARRSAAAPLASRSPPAPTG